MLFFIRTRGPAVPTDEDGAIRAGWLMLAHLKKTYLLTSVPYLMLTFQQVLEALLNPGHARPMIAFITSSKGAARLGSSRERARRDDRTLKRYPDCFGLIKTVG